MTQSLTRSVARSTKCFLEGFLSWLIRKFLTGMILIVKWTKLTKLTSSLQGEQPIWDNVGTMWRLQISCNTKEDWECSRADGWGRDTLEMTVQLQAKFYYIFAKSCWKVEVEVTWDCTRRNTCVTNAIPSYMIREDTGWDTSLVLSFLMACKVECVWNEHVDVED